MKKISLLLVLFTCISFAQDLNMQNGTFIRCSPHRFFDSGGETGNYGSNEDFTITICPETPGEIIILNFDQFRIQASFDIMTIYDGSSVTSNLLGDFSGNNSPGSIASSDVSGCLTIKFSSNGSEDSVGWAATISCAVPCQTITPAIDSTLPEVDFLTNQISIMPGQTVQFNGSAVFSDSGADASYFWNFGTGGTASTPVASHPFLNSGLYDVEFTVTDDNPLGCSETINIVVQVGSPIVSINSPVFAESSLGIFDLIDQVLVSGGCADVQFERKQVFGQPDDLTTKSYGFFKSNGTNFPFESGIVLTSGNAFLGGNTLAPLNDIIQPVSGNGQPGDIDLQNALGIIDTFDATFIEFEFVPTTDKVDFNYILASEEYGDDTECSFADGFAFLLTRPNGSTENLAVLPNGAVVNVTNINESNQCGANTNFFAGYNTDSPSFQDTNYGGRTEVLTASATDLIINETYVIKLVVADQGDDAFDTAIFIEAGSFDLGGNLGEDLTLASGAASCGGQTVTLDTRATNALHTWFFNGNPIPDAGTSSLLEISEAGTYSVIVEFAPGCSTEDSIIVEFRTSPEIISPAIDLAGCSTTGTAEFDLGQNTPIVFGGQDDTEFAISYHVTLEDANTGNNPITNISNYTATDGEIIFIRINDIAAELCVVIDNFLISVFTSVSSEDVVYELCDNSSDGDDTNGFTLFDLPSIDNLVLGTQNPAQFTVSYHINQLDAELGVAPLSNSYANTIANSQNIYARAQNNSNIDCYETSIITLVVSALPVIVFDVDLRQCDIDTDGLSTFNLTEANSLISVNAASESFSFYESLVDAENGNNPILDELNYPNTDSSSNPDLLFVRVENLQSCFRIAQLDLFVSTSEIPAGFVIPTYEECDDTRVDANIADGISVFDFSDATAQIENLFPLGQNITVTYFESIADALAEINPIADISNHINSASPFIQTITYRVDNNADNSCQGLGQFELKIINPTPRTDAQDLILCDDITVGDLSEEFDLTQNELFIYDGATTLVATYFLSNEDALNNVVANQILTPSTYGNTNVTETIFVRVEDVNTNCFAVVDFDVTVNPLPDLVSVATILECENQTDGIFDFNLGQKREEILNGKDSGEFIVTYHISQQDADDLINPQPEFFTNTVNPQQIFYAITNALTNCSSRSGSFFVEVLEGAQANSDGEPLDYELCDDNIDNDGITQFDLNTLESEILDGQDPTDYTISYHFSQSEALNDIAPLPFLYENLSNPQIIWARVSNNISPDICFEVQEIPLKVNPPPEFNLEDLYVLCITLNGTEVIPVLPILDTGLDMSRYTFEWFFNDTLIGGASRASYMPTEGGVYTVIVTDVTTSTSTFCSSSDSAEVIESAPPVISATVITDAFSDIHIIEVTAEGIGDYEYSLDGEPWQVESKFMDVSLGEHTITARDIKGCGESRYQVIVMDYPRFFTPNGDGYNDTWNISAINRQPSAKIFIYDRYGKMLKQLSPLGSGWNGTYNGNLLPSNDYWFIVEYNEPNTGDRKEFKAHFTLKR